MTAYDSLQLTADAAVPFQQEANFWYVTGIDEAGWQVVITREQAWLVAPDVSDIHRVFDGGLTDAEARMRSGIDDVLSVESAGDLLVGLSTKHSTAYTLKKDPHAVHYSFSLNPAPARLTRQLKRLFKEVRDIRPQLVQLRAIKRPEEVTAIKAAISLTIDAFRSAKTVLPELGYEYELEAEFTACFRRHNARHAYDPIVASGVNACTLHYGKNGMAWQDPSLVLIDIGARLDSYAADITRTYATGVPTDRQREVHEAVLHAHRSIIALLRPGLSFEQYQEQSDAIVKDALRSLGLLGGEDDYRRYFPHAISHGLGVDVHDSLGGFSMFKPGMVLTVEPGIYIPDEGIGVRLEDDILITETGYTNLSEALPLSL